MEKILFDDNSTIIYRHILRHELDLKLIKLEQTLHPLAFDDNNKHEGIISR